MTDPMTDPILHCPGCQKDSKKSLWGVWHAGKEGANQTTCPNCGHNFPIADVRELISRYQTNICTDHKWEAKNYTDANRRYKDETIYFCSKCGKEYSVYLAEQNIDLRARLEEAESDLAAIDRMYTTVSEAVEAGCDRCESEAVRKNTALCSFLTELALSCNHGVREFKGLVTFKDCTLASIVKALKMYAIKKEEI